MLPSNAPTAPELCLAICDLIQGQSGLTTGLSHDQSGVVSQIYLLSFTKTQNPLKPFGGRIRLCITCHELNFQGDWPKGADLAKKKVVFVSKDLFFAELLICEL